MNAPRITLDFETRSAADIKAVGGWVYSEHPSTDVVCLSYLLPGGAEPAVWVPDWVHAIIAPWYEKTFGIPVDLDNPWYVTDGMPDDLRHGFERGELVEAHNAFFERAIFRNVMGPRYRWPEPSFDQWRCSAAKASAYALPRALEKAAAVLRLKNSKDMPGHRTMQKVCRTRKARKKERAELGGKQWTESPDGSWTTDTGETVYLWNEKPEDLWATITYCRQDVRAEHELSNRLADLSPSELKVWQVDQAINLRGVQIDRQMADAAINMSDALVEDLTAEAISVAADGGFTTLGQRDKVLAWVQSRGVPMWDLQAANIDAALQAPNLPDDVRLVLSAKRAAGKASVKKYVAMTRSSSAADDRIRDTLMYHGAATGRWTGKLVQPQNFVRGKMTDPDTMCEIIRTGDLDWLKTCYVSKKVDAMTILSWGLRGAICAPPGRDLVVADYSGVEARGTSWLVGDDTNMEIFLRPKGQPGIYREMASSIYNVPAASIDKNTPDGASKRQIGKQAILGLGYGMGASKFRATCANYGIEITDKFAKDVVDAYRKRFYLTVEFWRDVEAAAIHAMRNPGERVHCGKVSFLKKGSFLYCFLPSGRPLAYCYPALAWDKTPWGQKVQKLVYMSVDGPAKKWVRTDTWGGKLTENIVQALCRDLMASAMVQAETDPDCPFDVVMTVHDELVTECDEDKGSVEELCALMCKLDDWAFGFPLKAEGWRGKRYRK